MNQTIAHCSMLLNLHVQRACRSKVHTCVSLFQEHRSGAKTRKSSEDVGLLRKYAGLKLLHTIMWNKQEEEENVFARILWSKCRDF